MRGGGGQGVGDYLSGKYLRMQKRMIPSFVYPQALYEEVLARRVGSGVRWLDLGCGHQVLPAWRLDAERALVAACRGAVGVDFDLDSLRRHRTIRDRIRADISRLPFPDECFDLVTANMVVEHLAEPRVQMCEISRVLVPGGRFILHTPNAWGYVTVIARMIPERVKGMVVTVVEGRAAADVYPAYYRLNTRSAIEEHGRAAGLELESCRYIVSQAKSNIVLPAALVELLVIRLQMLRVFRGCRANIISVLRRSCEGRGGSCTGGRTDTIRATGAFGSTEP